VTADLVDLASLRGARVLLVEDDPASARLEALVLREAHCEVEIATTASAATKLVVDGLRPAIVLLDLDLPDLTGMDLTKVFRSLDDTRDIPIVAVSASGIAFGERAALSAGCDGFVRKPIDTGTFPTIVAGFLQPMWTRPSRAASPDEPLSLQGRHEVILDAMPKALCVVRPSDLTVVYANRKFEQITGYTVAGLIGLPIAVANPDGGHGTQRVRDGIQQQLDAHGEGTFEVPRPNPDGSVLWIQATAALLPDPVLGDLWLMILDDVTKRRHADEALARTLARCEIQFSTLFNSGMLAIQIGGVSGRVLDANDTFLRLVGWSRDDLESGRFATTDFAPDEYHGLADLRANSVSSPAEREYRRKDGSSVPVLIGGAMLDGSTYIIFAIDLTEKHSREAALLQSQRRFDALWNSGMVGVAVSDNVGRVLEANDAYLAMVGYAHAELAAGLIDYLALTPPEHRENVGRATRQLAADGFAEPWRTETFRKDGSRIPVMVGVAGIDAQHSLAIVTDLSANVRAEEVLRRTEEQLRHAQKMDAVGRLAGGVAHDFNNMLSVIVSYSEMLLSDLSANDPMKADLEEISRAAMRASDLTRQLLIFSRQEVIEPTILNPNEVLLGMDRLLQRVLGEDIELVSVPGASLGQVQLGPSHLENVIVNLAVNARDSMPTGGKLTIETSNVDLDEAFELEHVPAKAGRYVMLAVTDTGCGMDRATTARIFDPFFTTKPVGEGTGLGLSIVFGIVQQCGGHLWVYSEPGHGTTFKLYFPRIDALRPAALAPTPLSPSALRGTETILLVEDEEQVRRVAHGILRRNGYNVLDAKNPGEALLLCENHAEPIALLLTDVVMPHMSGPELARRLSALRPEMRVLCMSGYTDDSVVRHGVLERGVAFLQKPLTPESLSRKVREVLDGPAQQRAA
jgi:PAS domain S-box-containing protein